MNKKYNINLNKLLNQWKHLAAITGVPINHKSVPQIFDNDWESTILNKEAIITVSTCIRIFGIHYAENQNQEILSRTSNHD